MGKILDFRSDTVTRPSMQMRAAIAAAEVGDDIMGDDPTANELCRYSAELTGMEDAIYVCSGTMGNLIALASAARSGESVLAGRMSHIWLSEVGGMSVVAGLIPYQIEDGSGIPSPEAITEAYREAGDIHNAPTSVLALENTHNYAGGIAVPPDAFAAAATAGHRLGLHVHLDGARIFNASVYHKTDVKTYTKEVDSVQFCLSKGLGAPLGSMLCGTHDFIERAKRWRKRLGGAQRQVGIAAAAGLYALHNNIERLAEDHNNARVMRSTLRNAGIKTEYAKNMTNMVYFKLTDNMMSDAEFIAACAERGVLADMISPRRVRLVTHIDITRGDAFRGAEIITEVLK